MIDTTAPRRAPAHAASGVRPGPVDALARRAVLRRLRDLPSGRLVIRDGSGGVAVGRGPADGLRAAITVHDPAFYRRVAFGGSLGAADAFVAGAFTCDDLTTLLRIFARHLSTTDQVERGLARLAAPVRRAVHALRSNTRRGSRRNIHAHYDLGNEFFALFLDDTMTYSCGIFERPDATLREASITKLDRLCRALDLRPSDHLLEIGTGWGSLAVHAATRYGCRVTTTTISREQHAWATRRVREAQVDDRVTVLRCDYRDLPRTVAAAAPFDKLISIEMIEAVGHPFLGTFFETCAGLLKDDGVMALQAITMPDQRYERYRRSVDFIQRDVFPGSCVPSVAAMLDATRRASDFRLVHLEDITPHYATTLRRWRDRFLAARPAARDQGLSDGFLRLWEFYLCYCEAGFAERAIGDVHMLLARPRYAPEAPA